MESRLVVLISFFVLVKCGYPPIGDEVVPGSVLLPATRRGRYLANIVRRQAVDGTGIKFNKDADRMNAEAKKKVDVLSEELLPYILAEQERRTTLYKRVMTAIQNGEKGVTVAEIRNKPPLIIRKGLMFRCPSNRAPKEPDGSGIIMCETEIEPTPVMYDSCLSAEDKELYIADNKYFFCNRHRVEGPDLPRNGSTVIGCAPMERTSLNYTSSKCALEDTDDVVVHYRYYPDRTYKFVTELDPDREVCDHWNPCQIGYIYSLPSPDQATLANELWHDYVERYEEYERDEIVPPIAEDTLMEYLKEGGDDEYFIAPRNVRIPTGYTFNSVWRKKNPYSKAENPHYMVPQHLVTTKNVKEGKVLISVKLSPFKKSHFGPYYAIFLKEENGRRKDKSVHFIELDTTDIYIDRKSVDVVPGSVQDPINLDYKCKKCRIVGILVRTEEGEVSNLSPTRWRTVDFNNGTKYLQVDVSDARLKDFGYYYVRFHQDSGDEQLVKSIEFKKPTVDLENKLGLEANMLRLSKSYGDHVDQSVKYGCDDCELADVTCNGESVLTDGKVSIVPAMKMISFNMPSFSNTEACAYMGVFKKDNDTYSSTVAVIDNASPAVTVEGGESNTVTAPEPSHPFEHSVQIRCEEDCHVEKVTVNGIDLDSGPTRRDATTQAYYRATTTSITVYISAFNEDYLGVYLASFNTREGLVSKTLFQITPNTGGGGGGGGGDNDKPEPEPEPGHTTEEPDDDKGTTEAHDGDETEAPNEETTADPGGNTVGPDGTTAEPGGTTAEAGETTAEPGGTTAEPGGTTAEAGGTTAEAGGTTAEPGATTAGPAGETTAAPEGETTAAPAEATTAQ